MSSAPRGPGGPPGASGRRPVVDDDAARQKGSVRAARERLQSVQGGQSRPRDPRGPPTNQPRSGLPSRPNQLVSQFSSQQGRRPWPEETLTPPDSAGNGLPAERSPGPQWPLTDDGPAEPRALDSPPRQSPEKRSPPQRPPRPSYVPSILDPSRPPEIVSPPAQARNQQQGLRSPPDAWQDDDFLSPTYTSPNTNRPLTTSSAASESSSLGSIPDFPVPSIQPPRRSPNLGPPPSARRGPSSYYSQMSYVSPIAEESSEGRSHIGSFASSNVIPSTANDFYYEDGADPSDEEEEETNPESDDGRDSRSTGHNDESGLVRKASLGKRGKPSSTTIKSGDNVRMDESEPMTQDMAEFRRAGPGTSAAVMGGVMGAGAIAPREQLSRGSSRAASSGLSSGTGLLDPSSSPEESLVSLKDSKEILGIPQAGASIPRSRSPLAPTDSQVAHRIIGGLEKGGALDAKTANSLTRPTRQSSLTDRVGARRPPRLNVDAVRDAEARGSLTSLPDLIRRATRLASNLDRGRTASRLGMEWFTNASQERVDSDRDRRSGSLSDMLAAFPPPGLATPQGEKHPHRPLSRWPSGFDNLGSTPGPSPKEPKRGRRCCGMPLWCFIILMMVLFLLICAAVLVPVVLLIILKQPASSGTDAQNALTVCQKSTVCNNGGTVTLDASGNCGCLCANGFTGQTCSDAGDAACVTTDIAGTSKATIGSSVSRLLERAESNFSIPLNSSALLSLFSAQNMSCTAENALVTFNGLAARFVPIPLVELSTPTTAALPTVSNAAAGELLRREPQPSLAAITSNGIVIAASVVPSATSPSSTQPSSSTSSSNVAISSNSTVINFARTGVLFVFQDTQSLQDAVTAQESLQDFFDNLGEIGSGSEQSIDLGNSYKINLDALTITAATGSVIGGGPNSTASFTGP